MYMLVQWPPFLGGSSNSVAPASCRSRNPAVNRRESLSPSGLVVSHKIPRTSVVNASPADGWVVGCQLVGWGMEIGVGPQDQKQLRLG